MTGRRLFVPCARRRSSRSLLTAGGAAAQAIPSEPVTFGAGRVVIGGDAAVAVAPEDNGFFNYSDYEQTTLRQVRLGMTALVRLSDRISLAWRAPIRELRVRRSRSRSTRGSARCRTADSTFRSAASRQRSAALVRRTYGHDNPLIGSPLAYQYLTSLRADSAPADEQELLRMRGRGWLVELLGRRPRCPIAACRWSARSPGTRACRCPPAGTS